MVILGYGGYIPVYPLTDQVCIQTDWHPYLCFSFSAYRFINYSIHLLTFTIMDYKSLPVYEKLKRIQELNFCRAERHNVAVYLSALRHNDRQVIDEYERFGDSPRQLLMNKREYERHLLFGFTGIAFNEYGWLANPEFLEREEIQFPHRNGWAVSNYITLGMGLNGKWTYGMRYSYSTGGHGYGLNVWGKLFDNRKDCLKAALDEMMTGLDKDSAKTDKYAIIVLKQVKSLFDEITGRKAIQLSLSFF
ncbi:MAG: hypothetical protein LBV71_04500 [Prevotella sp.]|nr:hypothetical protein [Prevotella sp.]